MIVKQMLALKNDSGKPEVTARAIFTLNPDATVGEAVQVLAEKRIGAVVVSADGKRPDGILSERDIVRAMGRNDDLRGQKVSALMTTSVQTCREGDDALTVLERMTEGRFRHMPVVDADGEMLGVISIGDAVSGRLRELHAEKEALTGMIMGA
ncbi:MAG: CBS domain-containing protein [Paracoccus sp. (in: a-proteobacteria)]|uniref:CBS domain-containing protein n=1 Tax=Paracoccus sp. TaxID=267 RepID=UPI0026E0150E|nr:CBS domain-containing protein [Paracoccus sp. (in: a-proteobacteria)]MDO5620167.1 CBS domain-containing protein [Paracoccus sp. (in: a-proteobacteria)]